MGGAPRSSGSRQISDAPHRTRVRRPGVPECATPVPFRNLPSLEKATSASLGCRPGSKDRNSRSRPDKRPERRVRRESGALSTLVVGQPDTTTSWKKEVSLRIAAHQNRKGWPMAKPAAPTHAWTAASSRAAQAAARVAARYAQAPSYSQLLDARHRPAPRAVRDWRFCAPKAPAAAQTVFADAPVDASASARDVPQAVESARSTARDLELDAEPLHLGMPFLPPASLQDWENECAHHRLEPDLRLRPIEQISAPISILIPEPNSGRHADPALSPCRRGRTAFDRRAAISFIASPV